MTKSRGEGYWKRDMGVNGGESFEREREENELGDFIWERKVEEK